MEIQGRRASDALRAVDGVVDSYLRHSNLGGRRIANLAATIAIEHSGARWGSLLLDEGEGLNPTLAIQDDLSAARTVLEGEDHASLRRAEDTAELVVQDRRLAAPIVLDGRVRGVLYLSDFPQPPNESIQELANLSTCYSSCLHPCHGHFFYAGQWYCSFCVVGKLSYPRL